MKSRISIVVDDKEYRVTGIITTKGRRRLLVKYVDDSKLIAGAKVMRGKAIPIFEDKKGKQGRFYVLSNTSRVFIDKELEAFKSMIFD